MSQNFCIACGRALRQNANFCGACGKAVTGAAQPRPAAPPQPVPPPAPPAPPPVSAPAPPPPQPAPPVPAPPPPVPAAPVTPPVSQPPPPPQPVAPVPQPPVAPPNSPPSPPPPQPVAPQPPVPAAPPLAFNQADWSSVEVQPGETKIDSWLVGLMGRGRDMSGIMTVTDRRVLFKPKVGGGTLTGMLISQLPHVKARTTVVLAKDRIVSVDSKKGVMNTRITITAADGQIYLFNRGLASADPILAAIGQGR